MSTRPETLEGRLVAVAGKAIVADIDVWFAYRTLGGEDVTQRLKTGQDGSFTFPVPPEPLERAAVGAELEGVTPVDLAPDGAVLEPGDVVLMIDDLLPSHLRYAG